MLHVIIGLTLLSYILFESQKEKYVSENTGFIVGSALVRAGKHGVEAVRELATSLRQALD